MKKFDFMLANISQAHFILQKEKCNSGISRDEQHILVVRGTDLLTLAKWMSLVHISKTCLFVSSFFLAIILQKFLWNMKDGKYHPLKPYKNIFVKIDLYQFSKCRSQNCPV